MFLIFVNRKSQLFQVDSRDGRDSRDSREREKGRNN